MSTSKVTISLNSELLRQLDHLVRAGRFASRSQAIQKAIEDNLARMRRTRLARESAKLSRKEEQSMAN